MLSLCSIKINNQNTTSPANKKASAPNFFGKISNKDELEIKGKETTAKVFTKDVNYDTYAQIKTIASHPIFKDTPIRIMPDTHAGKTAVVGFTAPVECERGIIPSLISGDIGCGMLCVQVDTNGENIDFEKLDNIIHSQIASQSSDESKIKHKYSKDIVKPIEDKCKEYNTPSEKALNTLGTLGNGNHFIELDKDKNDNIYLIIHTGSRGLGTDIYNHYQSIATKQNPYNIKDLSYLSGDEAKEYLQDSKLAIKYSRLNRRIIADEIIKGMGWKEKSSFESIHNYIDDDGILRKGSIKAYSDDKILIPLNMRDGAIIAKGKGNPDWNYSAPHGAGRQYSRSDASTQFDINQYKQEMNGVYSSCINEKTLDESPMAYKNSDMIINTIKDTAEIIDIIKPIYNFKN